VSTNVTVIATPVSPSPTVVPVSICQGDSFELRANVTGTNYLWTYPNGSGSSTLQNPTVKGGVAGQYCLRYKQNGCWSADSCVNVVIHPLPSVTATAFPTSIAVGDSAILTASGVATYQWSNGMGSSATVVVKPTQTSIYTVTSTQSGCSATAQVTVSVIFPCANPPIANAGANQNYVSGMHIGGNPTAVGGTSPYTYSWSPATGLNSATVPNPIVSGITASQTYTVTIKDSNNCSSTASVVVTYVSPCANPPIANAGANLNYVSGMHIGGNPTASGGTAPYTYAWAPPTGLSATTVANPNVLGITTSQTYTVTVIDNNGCTATSSIVISTIGCDDSISVTKTNCNVLSASFVQGATYQWKLNGQDIVGASSRIYSSVVDLSAGLYTVLVKIGGCEYQKDIAVSFPCSVGVEELMNGEFDVFPNPNNGVFTVSFERKSIEFISVYDALGRTLISKRANANKMSIDITDFDSGVYFVEVISKMQKGMKSVYKF
jgi:hypothetical protein